MKIVFIEPTPSPNTMKLHLDESLEPGIRKTYTLNNERSAPAWIRGLLQIPGVKSVFHTADFVALDRKGNADWAAILSEVQKQFGQEGVESAWTPESGEASGYGEAQVFVQFFRGIPMQIRVKAGNQEERISLSERFVNAVTEVASATLIKERKLVDYGVRYGELPDIAREIEQELEAAYPPERLKGIVEQAIAHGRSETEFVEQRRALSLDEIRERMKDPDWRVRYAALESLQQPSAEALPLLAEALRDPQCSPPARRRLPRRPADAGGDGAAVRGAARCFRRRAAHRRRYAVRHRRSGGHGADDRGAIGQQQAGPLARGPLPLRGRHG